MQNGIKLENISKLIASLSSYQCDRMVREIQQFGKFQMFIEKKYPYERKV